MPAIYELTFMLAYLVLALSGSVVPLLIHRLAPARVRGVWLITISHILGFFVARVVIRAAIGVVPLIAFAAPTNLSMQIIQQSLWMVHLLIWFRKPDRARAWRTLAIMVVIAGGFAAARATARADEGRKGLLVSLVFYHISANVLHKPEISPIVKVMRRYFSDDLVVLLGRHQPAAMKAAEQDDAGAMLDVGTRIRDELWRFGASKRYLVAQAPDDALLRLSRERTRFIRTKARDPEICAAMSGMIPLSAEKAAMAAPQRELIATAEIQALMIATAAAGKATPVKRDPVIAGRAYNDYLARVAQRMGAKMPPDPDRLSTAQACAVALEAFTEMQRLPPATQVQIMSAEFSRPVPKLSF
jgi:hypothetical protein